MPKHPAKRMGGGGKPRKPRNPATAIKTRIGGKTRSKIGGKRRK